jgi:hypothetical protein
MKTKKISKNCHSSLPLPSISNHSRMLDGHLNFCIECVKGRVSAHRACNLDKINAYDRERAQSPHRKDHFAQLKERVNADPLRRKAHQLTSNAIRDGRLIRPGSCSLCDKQCKPEAHHDDYSRPLDVRWLCRSCHCRHHRLEQLLGSNQVEAA